MMYALATVDIFAIGLICHALWYISRLRKLNEQLYKEIKAQQSVLEMLLDEVGEKMI